LFGRKSRAEKLKEARDARVVSGATLAAAYDRTRPIAERVLYDDDLRDNIRTFIDSSRKILEELSDEHPTEILDRLWDDNKLRREVEAAVEAAQEAVRRVQGQRVRTGGRSGRILLLLVLAGIGFLFLNPKTGPDARRIAGDVVGSLRSGS
jgi:hypothetical protein